MSRTTSGFAIREARKADLPAIVELVTRAEPDDPPVTLETVQWVIDRADPDRPHPHLVATVGDGLVGWTLLRGVASLDAAFLIVAVDPDARRQGIGTALLDRALGAAAGESEVVAVASAAAPDALAFAEHRGFEEEHRVYESRLEMSTFDPDGFGALEPPLVLAGYRFSFLSEEDSPALRRSLHELNETAVQDIPAGRPIQPTTFAVWLRDWIEAPHALPQAFSVALRGDEPVAFSYVVSQSEGVGYTWMTAVARAHRGHGLGLAVKVRALRAANAIGLRQVLTNNDPDNGPMLAINRRLGFRDLPARVWFRKALTGS
jgi:GNAT superfamily N-acetyltransferase